MCSVTGLLIIPFSARLKRVKCASLRWQLRFAFYLTSNTQDLLIDTVLPRSRRYSGKMVLAIIRDIRSSTRVRARGLSATVHLPRYRHAHAANWTTMPHCSTGVHAKGIPTPSSSWPRRLDELRGHSPAGSSHGFNRRQRKPKFYYIVTHSFHAQ